MKIFKSIVTLALAGLTSAAVAQPLPEVAKLKPSGFPNQPIEFTVVYPAGGGMDLTARLLAKFSEQVSGDKILVNNRTGGAGMIGHAYLATQAKPDGYTVGIVANLVWGDTILRSQGKWTLADIEPIAYINSDALTWVSSTKGAFKGKSAKEIIQVAKDKPGTVRIAVVPGSMWEYLVDQIEQKTGAKFLRVPFQGGKPGIVAMLGNNVDVAQGFYGEFQSYMDAGDVAPIAVASSSRISNLKNVPTFNEIYNTNDIVWNIIRFAAVPKATPADRKAYLAAIVKAAVKQPGLIEEYNKLGAYFDPSLMNSGAIAKDLNDMAMREREFYIATGRLKQ